MERVKSRLFTVGLIIILGGCDNPVDMRAVVEDKVMVSNARYLGLESIDIPVDGSGLFNPTGTMEFVFDRDIDLSTVTPETLVVMDSEGDPIIYPENGITWVSGSKTLRLRVYPYLPVDEDFTVTVTKDILGSDGSRIREGISRSFQTKNVLAGSINSLIGSHPNSLPGYAVTSSVDFQFQVSDYYRYFKYRVSLDGGTSWSSYYPSAGYVDRNTLTDGIYDAAGIALSDLGITTEGAYELTFQFSGNDTGSGSPTEGLTDSISLTYDAAAPSPGTMRINSDAAYTTKTPVEVGYTVIPSDTLSGVGSMRLSNNGSTWTAWVAPGTTAAWDLLSSAGGSSTQGTRTVYIQTRDNAGNISASATDTIVYDATAPTAGTWTVNAGGTYTVSTSVTMEVSSEPSEALSGLAKISFSNNGTTWSEWEAYSPGLTKAWNLATGAGGSTAQGTRTVYARLMDGAGNISTSGTDAIIYDITAPSVGTWFINSNVSYTNAATVTMAASTAPTDSYSGVAQMSLSNNGTTWSPWEAYSSSKSWDSTSATYGGTATEGTKFVYIRFKDGAGNISGATSDKITRDVTLPSPGAMRINSGNTYVNTASVTLSYTTAPTDSLSGVTWVRYSSNGSSWTSWLAYTSTYSWSLSNAAYGGTNTEGTRYAYIQVQDAAGNTSPTISDSIIYDYTAPSGYLYAGGSADPSEINGSYTTIYFYVTDNLSGIAQRENYNYYTSGYMAPESYTATKTWVFPAGNGTRYFYGKFTDGAGNVAYLSDSVTVNSAFSSLNRSDIALDRTDINGDSNVYMSTSSISMSDGNTNINPGQIYTYYTSSGNYGKLVVKNFIGKIGVVPFQVTVNYLYFDFVTYASNGTVVASGTDVTVQGTYSFDLDTGVQTSTNRDFWWSISSDTVRSLVPQNGAKFFNWN